MRTCHLTTVHPYNDIRIYIKECRSLANYGFETYLVVPNAPSEVIEGVHILGFPVTANTRLIRMTLVASKIFIKSLSLKADIYHFHDPELIFIGILLKIYGKKIIYDVHEDVPRQMLSKTWISIHLRCFFAFLFELIENFSAKKFDAIICATPYIRDRFANLGCRHVIDVNNFPIWNELNSAKFHNKEKRTVCYIGSISEARGILEMIEAVGKANVKLLLAGKFCSNNCREKSLKVAGWCNVDELGSVNRDEVNNILLKSIAGLVILHPNANYIKSLPIKMFEYMAAGIPVIASNFPLWIDIIEKNNCGICVDPFNINQIVQAIRWLVDNLEDAKRMGENGRRLVERNYTWESERIKLYNVYKKLES